MSKPSRSSARPAARWRWQRTAQKKRSARSKRRNSALVNRPLPTRSAGLVDAEHILADPVERMEVAKPALAVLDVGFDDIAAVAHAAVALVALGQLGGDIVAARPGDDFGAESGRSPERRAPRRPTASALRAWRCARSCPIGRRRSPRRGCGPTGRPSASGPTAGRAALRRPVRPRARRGCRRGTSGRGRCRAPSRRARCRPGRSAKCARRWSDWGWETAVR